MGATFALLIVGVLKWGWYINELSALFLGMGIVVGFEARVGFDGFGRLFSRGVADFAAGALAVGFARGILIVLEGGNILHTILYGASGLLTSLPSSLTVLGMYVFQNFLNLLIPSASGQAATSLPILLPHGRHGRHYPTDHLHHLPDRQWPVQHPGAHLGHLHGGPDHGKGSPTASGPSGLFPCWASSSRRARCWC